MKKIYEVFLNGPSGTLLGVVDTDFFLQNASEDIETICMFLIPEEKCKEIETYSGYRTNWDAEAKIYTVYADNGTATIEFRELKQFIDLNSVLS